jgi:uncharacterized membrane protein (DUF4010 family)
MKFAMDTFKDVAYGSGPRRVHALLTFGLWFSAGAFLVSTAQFYVGPMDSMLASVVGGAVVSAGAAALKLS